MKIKLAGLFLTTYIYCFAVDVLTSEYNLNRTNHNPFETELTRSNVSAGCFGKLGTHPVKGILYARPLALDNYPFSTGTQSAVFYVTSENVMYAYRQGAYGTNALIWSLAFGPPLPFAFTPQGPVHGSKQFLTPNCGVISTPVIDRQAGIIYAVFNDGSLGNARSATYKIARVKIATGELIDTTKIAAKFSGPGDQFSDVHDVQDGQGNFLFDAHWELQRVPLALANGNLYIAFSSYGDERPGHGEIISYRTADMTQNHSWTCSPSTNADFHSGLCSIWQSGRGIPIDESGNLYLSTGNGGFDGVKNLGDSWVKLSSTLELLDWYSPQNNTQINSNDWDISSSGPLLVPGTSFLVGGAKDRLVRVMPTSHMGHSDPGDGSGPTKSTGTKPCNTFCAGVMTGIYHQSYSPVDSMFYESDVDGPLYGMPFDRRTGILCTPTVRTAQRYAFPGAFSTVSYNAEVPGTSIVWASTAGGEAGMDGKNAFIYQELATLRAFNAATLEQIYSSEQAPGGRDRVGNAAKFQPPMPINGKVYLPSNSGYVAVYGLGKFAAWSGQLSSEPEEPVVFPRQWTFQLAGVLVGLTALALISGFARLGLAGRSAGKSLIGGE